VNSRWPAADRTGSFTPGRNPVGEILDYAGVPADLRGLCVLDIGAWHGCFSFECERLVEGEPDTVTGLSAGIEIPDVPFDHFHDRFHLGEVSAVPSGEVVEGPDAGPALDEGVHEVGSDEAASPGYQNGDAREIGDWHPGQALTTGQARVPAGKRLRVSTTSFE